MGWAERLNPKSWEKLHPAVRSAYCTERRDRDRAEFEAAMASKPVPAGIGVVPKFMKAWAGMMAAAASLSLARKRVGRVKV